MKYWLTTHWPSSIRQGKVEPHENVWVQDGLKEVIEPVPAGDRVFIYETGGGKREADVDLYGKTVQVKRDRGRQGVVALLEVTGAATEVLFKDRIRAPTKSINSKGFVERARVCEVLNWKPAYSLRGIGPHNSGLQELTEQQFQTIHEDFLCSLRPTDDVLQQLVQVPTVRHGNGGEGAEHRTLKHLVARDPSGVLGEEGLRFVKMEVPFATNDRVDLILQDRDGRYVVVEIEVDCGPRETAGPLQCLKYQVMWAYMENRPVEEVRTMLVARSMDAGLIQRARNVDIECKIVPRGAGPRALIGQVGPSPEPDFIP